MSVQIINPKARPVEPLTDELSSCRIHERLQRNRGKCEVQRFGGSTNGAGTDYALISSRLDKHTLLTLRTLWQEPKCPLARRRD